MSRRLSAAFLVVLMALTPLVPMASAHSEIGLSVDSSHVILSPGDATNITLSIHNNGSSIVSYNLSVAGQPSPWEVILSQSTINSVIPTTTVSTTIAVRLSTSALPSDSGNVTITVTEPSANISSEIVILLSVSPRYLPAIDTSTAGDNGLVEMNPGQTVNLSVEVRNDGNVDDTLLLSVDQSPDLAGFWANWTSSGNQSNNSSNNGTGNNSSSGNTTILNNILMFGNSYTQYNSLNLILEDLGIVNADAITSGGNRLSGHWDDVNTSGHNSNTTLRSNSTTWDYVVLQDQSQIPGFYRTNSDWIDSKNGAVSLAGAISDESSEAVLMMTWGRRSGDTNNPTLYSNFTVMQERLEQGYIDYRDNMSNSTIDVWIAPVGLAFQHIHDAVNASGTDPTTSGNTFYDLYSSDGSHPSLSGSYLAACVLYATMTGSSPVGSNDSVSLNSSLKLELQQAASATVFNETSYLSYPWQNNNTTTLMSSPQGWEVRFLDDTLDNMSAGETRTATLRISIPANENPDYYGFDLFAGTTLGNFSVSSTLVVNVTAVHDLTFTYVPSGVLLQPGENTTVILDLDSLSTADDNWTWSVSVDAGDCQAILPSYSTSITSGGSISVHVVISTNANSHVGDECDFTLSGVLDIDSTITESVSFTLIVGQQWNLSMILPEDVNMEVGFEENILVLITNNGSEQDDLLLEVADVEGMTITTPDPVTLERGESQYVPVTLLADSTISGEINISFSLSSANSAGESIDSLMTVMVATHGDLSIAGPSDNRVVIVAGSNGTVTLNLTNIGTHSLDLEPSILGLPSGISVLSSNANVIVDVDESVIVEVILLADTGMHPLSSNITLKFSDGITTTSLTIELQVINRIEVSVDVVSPRIVASPLNDENLTIMVTNLGTGNGTFLIDINTDETSDWFAVNIDKLSLSLEPGESGSLTLSVREIATGAPTSGAPLPIVVTSTADSSANDTLTVILVPQVADGIITIMSDDDTAKPGETIYGTVIVTNMGTATDSMLITTLELDCGLDELVQLGPSMSSAPIEWSCIIPEGASAGLDVLTFRLTSSARSDLVITSLELYTVKPVWGTSGVITFDISEDDFKMEMRDDKKILVRICNQANTVVSGSVEVTGTNSLRMHATFSSVGGDELNSTFELANLGCKDFNLLLVTQDLDGYQADIIVRAVTQVEGSTVSDESSPIEITVIGPHKPPEGINFGFMEINNQNSMTALASGWIFALLLLAYIRYFRKPAIEEDEEEDREKELVPLGINEVRVDENGKVTCCSCEQLLGIPRGNEPPFKFTCPKCSIKIRVVE